MTATPTYTRRFRSKKQLTERIPTRKLVCFAWGGERFALAIAQVQHILNEFTPHGQLDNGCSLVRHNHDIIPLIDLGQLFPNRLVDEPNNYVIICNSQHQTIGIPVGHIPAIMDVTDHQFQDVPAVYQRHLNRQVMEHVIQLADGTTLFYLNPAKFVQ